MSLGENEERGFLPPTRLQGRHGRKRGDRRCWSASQDSAVDATSVASIRPAPRANAGANEDHELAVDAMSRNDSWLCKRSFMHQAMPFMDDGAVRFGRAW